MPDPKQTPEPGVMHPTDKAFYDLTVKERDYERMKVDRLEKELRKAHETINKEMAEYNV